MKQVRLFIFLLLCFSMVANAQPSAIARRITAVENSLMPYVPVVGLPGWNIYDRMKHYKVPGVTVAVINQYKIDWVKSYGLADTTKRLPVTAATLFSAGSISKMVLAAAAMKLVQEGRLALDSPINNYLTSWKIKENDFTRNKPVTLRMLLSHTAGTSQSAYWGFTPGTRQLPTVVETLSGAPVAESNPVVVNSEPGKEFRYSGGGSLIAQLAVMDVTKMDFAAYIQKNIFEPLGMTNSSFVQPLPTALQAKAAWGYSAASWYKGMPYVYPQLAAAGLYTNATDLAKFIIALQKSLAGTGNFLSKQTALQMLTPQATISQGQYLEQIGLGPFLLELTTNNNPAGNYFEHQGANAGFIAFAMGSVDGGNGVVIMMNTGDDFNAFGTELRRAVAKTYQWINFLPPPVTPAIIPLATLKMYEGRYRKGPDEVVTIVQEKNYLLETINEGNPVYCFPVGNDSIVLTDYNIKGFFTKNEMGAVNGLQLAWQDKPMSLMKLAEFTPGENLKAGRYAIAKEGYRSMNMNEYQITGMVYDLLAKKPFPAEAIKTLLDLASEQHPQSSVVYARWGDYYVKMRDSSAALVNYKKALELDPENKELKTILLQYNSK